MASPGARLMIALAAGVLLVCASAAGWVLIALVVVDVLRQGRAAKVWRPDPPRLEDLP